MNIDESHNAKGFTPGSQVNREITTIYIHHWGNFGQTHDGVVDFFENGPGATSAHFVASGGRVSCLVSPADVAWHAGTWDQNLVSLGIECRPEASDADYTTVAELVKWLRDQYGDLPLKPHRANYNTSCPGIWDLARIDSLARGLSAPAAIIPQSASQLAAKPAPEPQEGQFRVDPGDTLTSIANQFGWTVQSIIDANPGINPNLIFPGQILQDGAPAAAAAAPAPAGLPPYCLVDPGDTLSGIADQYGVSLQYILDRNPGIDANLIFPGQRINL